MSLILEALKKLEREKPSSSDRGFLVLAHLPWAQAAGSRRGRWVGLGLLALALAVAGAAFRIYRGAEPSARVAAPSPASGTPPSAAPAPVSPIPPERRAPPLRGPAAEAPPPRAGVTPEASSVRPSGPAPVAPAGAAAAEVAPAPATAIPPSAASEPGPDDVDLRLNAISQQDGRPVAIVNDRLVREGDAFGGIRIVRIGEDHVEVEVDGKRRILRF